MTSVEGCVFARTVGFGGADVLEAADDVANAAGGSGLGVGVRGAAFKFADGVADELGRVIGVAGEREAGLEHFGLPDPALRRGGRAIGGFGGAGGAGDGAGGGNELDGVERQ